MTGKTVVRRIHADPKAAARMAEILSVRAVELLRASFLELAITSRPRPDVVDAPALPVEPVVTRFATEPLVEAEPDWKWAFEAGAGGIGAASGLGRRARRAAAGRAHRTRAGGAAVRARDLRGPGDAVARRHPTGGFADVSQTVVLAEALFRFRRGSRVEPVVSVGAGMLRLAAEGHVIGALHRRRRLARSRRRPTWASACACRCAGGGWSWASRCTRCSPSRIPSCASSTTDVARAGRPTLLAAVTLLGGI